MDVLNFTLPTPQSPTPASLPATVSSSQTPYPETWGIYTLAGKAVFDVDSCVDLKYGNGGKVSAFPVEKGSFASYNKVQSPFQVKLRLSVGGQKRMAAFMAALETETAAANLYNVYTPEATYKNATLEKFDYARSAEHGRNLIVADLTLVEIREVTPAYSSVALPASKVKNPKAGSKVPTGKVQTKAPENSSYLANCTPQEAFNYGLAQQRANGTPSMQVLK